MDARPVYHDAFFTPPRRPPARGTNPAPQRPDFPLPRPRIARPFRGRLAHTPPRPSPRQPRRQRPASPVAATASAGSSPPRRLDLRLAGRAGSVASSGRPGTAKQPGAAGCGSVRRAANLVGVAMSNESLIVILVVGLIAGWLAGQIMRGSGFGLIGDLVVGIIGAFIGDWLLPQLGLHLGAGLVALIITRRLARWCCCSFFASFAAGAAGPAPVLASAPGARRSPPPRHRLREWSPGRAGGFPRAPRRSAS